MFPASVTQADNDYGYLLVPVSFQWDDPAAAVDMKVDADDGLLGPLPIGFPFSFYGLWYEYLFVSPNGWLGFAKRDGATIPGCDKFGASWPDAMISVYGGDRAVLLEDGGRILYRTTGEPGQRKLIVTFLNVREQFDDPDSLATFQVILDELTGDIEMRWQTVPAAAQAAVGIEDETGAGSLQPAECPFGLEDASALRFYHPAGVYLRAQEAQAAAPPQEATTHTIEVRNRTGLVELFDLEYHNTDWTVEGPATVGPLAAGETREIEISVLVPEKTPYLAENSLRVEAIGRQNPVKVSDELWLKTICAFPWIEGRNLPWRLAQMVVVDSMDKTTSVIGGVTKDYPGGTTTHFLYQRWLGQESWLTEGDRLSNLLYAAAGARIDDTIFIPGGRTGDRITDNLYVYDIQTDIWTHETDTPVPVAEYGAAAIDEKLYRVGGLRPNGSALKSCLIYDPETGLWSDGPDLEPARSRLALVAVDGLLYAIGGLDSSGRGLSDVQILGPDDESWQDSKAADLPVAIWDAAAAAFGGLIYVAGGYQSKDGVALVSDQVWIYNSHSDRWHLGPPLPQPGYSGGLAGQSLTYLGGLAADGVTIAKQTYLMEGPWPLIDSVIPESFPYEPEGELTVNGRYFEPGVAFKILKDGQPIIPLLLSDGNTSSAMTGILGDTLPLGEYGILAINPDGQTATLDPAFSITEAEPDDDDDDQDAADDDDDSTSAGCGC